MNEEEITQDAQSEQRINLTKEEIEIGKKTVETGTHIFSKEIVENRVNLEVELADEEYQIERHAVHSEVDTMPQVRTEGDTTIIPVVKEVAVVVKKLMLVEEIHITRKVNLTAETVTETVREEVLRHQFRSNEQNPNQ